MSDKERRQNYDQFGHAAFDGAGGRGGFANFDFTSTFSDIFGSDIFDDFFDGFGGGRRSGRRRQSENRGVDLRYDLTISLGECVFKEKNKKLNIHHLRNATDVMATVLSQAPILVRVFHCVLDMVRLGLIKVFSRFNKPAPNVEVSGEEISNPCKNCRGIGKKQTNKKLFVTIPKGVDDGTRIRLSGKGERLE